MKYPMNMLFFKDGKVAGFNPSSCTAEQTRNWCGAVEYGVLKGMTMEQACQYLFKQMVEGHEKLQAVRKECGELETVLQNTEHSTQVLMGKKRAPVDGYNPEPRIDIPMVS